MSYHKTIKYLDYCEEGQRVKSGGVWKVEKRDHHISMEVILRDLPFAKTAQKDVVLQAAGQEHFLGKIKLSDGNGVFTCQWDEVPKSSEGEATGDGGISVGKADIPAEEWEKLIVPIDEDCYVVGIWQVHRETNPKKESEANPMELEAETMLQKSGITEPIKTDPNATIPMDMRDAGKRELSVDAKNKIAEEKWQHLWQIYPHIKPYGDDREYLSVRPADFLIFQEECYRRVNNSFLLHGYYNYGHLILARIRRQSEYAYYVGAPGSFFEREKQVAIMFGFESFECEKEPAQAGDFGYYMMRVHL